MTRAARLVRLASWERRVVARALVLLPLMALRLRLLGLRRARLAAAPQSRPIPAAHADSTVRAERIARLVDIVAREGPWSASCLPASLTLQRLLLEAGIESEMRLGVRKVAGRLDAHAWVECDGVALSGAARLHESFAPFNAPLTSAAGAPP